MSQPPSNTPPSATAPGPAPSRSRRASIASGTSFSELFSRAGNVGPPPPPPASARNGRDPIMSAATSQAQQRRRMSITTLGLSGSPTQPSPFGNQNARRGSVSSSVMSGSPSGENAVVEENDTDTPMTSPTTPFARRVSFGAQAFRDRVGSVGTNGRYSSGIPTATLHRSLSTTSSSSASSSVVPAAREGFNWPEALRTRAERAPSIGSFSAGSPTAPQGLSSTVASTKPAHHQRAASVATMEQPPQEPRAQQKPQQPKAKPKPDYFQEKILRADFMD
ncbi:hypothetical protein FQN53_002638 [Emmonsiellopsis sp. PD_33]|nr:hypothetical protein FQN53_002638 [Emmonsiellopsis sp. PD_33]